MEVSYLDYYTNFSAATFIIFLFMATISTFFSIGKIPLSISTAISSNMFVVGIFGTIISLTMQPCQINTFVTDDVKNTDIYMWGTMQCATHIALPIIGLFICLFSYKFFESYGYALPIGLSTLIIMMGVFAIIPNANGNIGTTKFNESYKGVDDVYGWVFIVSNLIIFCLMYLVYLRFVNTNVK